MYPARRQSTQPPGPPRVRPTAPRGRRETALKPVGSPSLVPETPRPNPQSQSFSRSYGSVLPTSLTYIILSTRGCSPWRPDAVVSTTLGANKSLPQIFKGRRERTGHRKDYGALPAVPPYRRAIRFQGHTSAVRKKRELFPGPPQTSLGSLVLPHIIHVSVREY